MGIFGRQFNALLAKNFIILRKNLFINTIRCLVLPTLFILFVAETQHFFTSTGTYGVGDKFRSIKTLDHALIGDQKFIWMDQSQNATLANVLIADITSEIPQKNIYKLANRTQLDQHCPENFNQVSGCFAAVVFQTLEWTETATNFAYQLRLDNGLYSTNVFNGKASLESHHFPVQWAVDSSIFRAVFGDDGVPPTPVEVPFTTITQSQRLEALRLSFVRGTREIIALAFLVGFVGVIYHLVGYVCTERELLLTQLLDVMGCSNIARLLSWHVSFDLFYGPSWILSGVILQQLVFTESNGFMVVIFHILFGLALVSWSLFVAVFFKRAQLSGFGSTVAAVLLGIVAMVGKNYFGNVGVIVLCVIFPPMSLVFAYIIFCNFERYSVGVDMLSTYGQSDSTMIAVFICLGLDIILFAFLALLTEHWFYGTGKFVQTSYKAKEGAAGRFSLELQGLTKIFKPFSLRKKEPFYAVNGLTLQIKKGEVFCLLGANGSGKSTTLQMIAGALSITGGDVLVNGMSRRKHRYPPGVLALCPQKNILWSDLTVLQHVQIWSRIKSVTGDPEDVVALIESCDLSTKIKSESATLSGGMKRKLQLACAFCGGSQVILIDEVSSGIDPLARRKLHDIILDNRGSRTQILTTHFLDEADLLADRIALLSKGVLQAEGVPVALKAKLGKGYKLNVIFAETRTDTSQIDSELQQMLSSISKKIISQHEVEYDIPTIEIGRIRNILAFLEGRKVGWAVENYEITGPRLEDVFLSVMEDANTQDPAYAQSIPPSSSTSEISIDKHSHVLSTGKGAISADEYPLPIDTASSNFTRIALASGRQTAVWEQVLSQFRKRLTIAMRNPWPSIAAIVVGVVAASVALVFLTGNSPYRATCQAKAGSQNLVTLPFPYFNNYTGQPVLLGPNLRTFRRSIGGDFSIFTPVIVDSPAQILDYVRANYSSIAQGGIYINNATNQASFAWLLSSGIFLGLGNLNVISNTLFDNTLAARGFTGSQSTGYKITTTYRGFDSPHYGELGNSLKFLVFFGVAMCVMFSFASLYPTSERLRDVKSLHFSNGMQPISLHLGHLAFELPTTAIIALLITVIYAAVIPGLVHDLGTFFVVLWLYGIAATLLSMIVALFARSQLAAFALATGIQAVMFLCYIVAYLLTLTYAPALNTTAWIRYEHFTISAIPIPVASIARAIIVGLNMFSLSCVGPNGTLAGSFSTILLYGGPILYLVLQCFALFGFLVWWDSGHQLPVAFRRKVKSTQNYAAGIPKSTDVGVVTEAQRVNSAAASDVLLVCNISKSYGSLQAVQNVSFGVARDEVFALLGPNSAGKSTTYGMIRGEVTLDSGNIFIDGRSIATERNAARASLGVCPQFDAMDSLSVRQHLTFYARVKGIPRKHITQNVEELIAAVSLTPFADRLARKLSGGNQRKLSLAISMLGDPSVLLIDEASSGMDIAAKRKIWATLANFMPGRAVVITTHSMEEADALANRVGIIAKKLLAVDEISAIRRRYGQHYELAIICEQSDDVSELDARCSDITRFILQRFPGSAPESGRAYHGHLKFKIPTEGSVAGLFDAMEDNKVALKIEYYGIQRSTLETAFLKLIRQHNVREEGYAEIQEVPKSAEGKSFASSGSIEMSTL